MGKRKVHGKQLVYCDWTGHPITGPPCWIPNENLATGKIQRMGHYVNWESALAHAEELYDGDAATLKWVRDTINEHVGCTVARGAHYSKLACFGGDATMQTFLAVCGETQFSAVVVSPEVGIEPRVINIWQASTGADVAWQDYLHPEYPGSDYGLASVELTRKKTTGPKNVAFFMHFIEYNQVAIDAPPNEVASKLSKRVGPIFGTVIIVKRVVEESPIGPRIRHLDLNDLSDFASPKKKEKRAMTTTDYEKIKDEMTEELQAGEALSSASASVPGDLAKASLLPPPTGAEIAALLKEDGESPPKKKKRVQPIPISAAEVAAGTLIALQA